MLEGIERCPFKKNKMTLQIFTQEELKQRAESVFNRYPNAKRVAVASDGEAFIVDNGDMYARNHATKNRHKKKLELFEFGISDFETKTRESKRTKKNE
jgi:hypothetical protein